ncbi:MAG TPA: thioredoxin [Blastocatellia bacterium]|nr:thioredoxin [Blastocatellia bacterium]HAF21382.1 thioredoxin [Blastocatellia bacterium]HCX31831.1 thioredoxin [Blastocatellia bacterium]
MPVVACNNCGTKNRVDPDSADGHIAKCGKCGTPLPLPAAAGETAPDKPLVVTDDTFQRDVLNARGLVLLDCWAPWCGPCRMVGPIMEQLAAESNGRYRIAKLNVDDNQRTAAQFQIQSIPTMLIFKDGKLVDRLIGAQPKPAIAARLLVHAA